MNDQQIKKIVIYEVGDEIPMNAEFLYCKEGLSSSVMYLHFYFLVIEKK